MRLSVLLYTMLLLATLLPFSNMVFANEPSPNKQAIQRILVWGDSISAAYGMQAEQGWVQLLARRINAITPQTITITNGSISGETTQGGLTRLPAALAKHQPDLLIIELGGNDGLRGLPTQQMYHNLEQMILLAQERAIDVILLGMKIPPNYGPTYTRQFETVYQQIADRYKIILYPFFLENIALNTDLMQSDGIHPNAEAQNQLVDNIWPLIYPFLLPMIDSN